MMSSRTKLTFGITLSLLTPAIAVVGCGGDNSAPRDVAAGGNASGGSSAGSTTTGGTAGAATGGATTGGTAGAGGSAGAGGAAMTPYPCNASILEPTAFAITDFSITAMDGTQMHWGQMLGDAGVGVSHDALWGGIFQYGSDGAVTYTLTDAAMVIGGDVSGYSGAGIWFGPCVDATAFTGIQFDVSGMPGDSGQITVMLQTNTNSPVSDVDMRGACLFDPPSEQYSDCAQPAITRPVTDTVTTITVPFADLAGGKPSAGTDGSDLVGMQFQFAWSDTATAYSPSITVDNIQFIAP